MLPTPQGSIRLFRLAGIDVYLHWLWLLGAVYFLNGLAVWSVLEYLALFAIVLLHEFGHALACRQVGGKANQIVLWPLGGVAYVSPPPRPGATLWSIAAGPLVNVILAPILTGVWFLVGAAGWMDAQPNAYNFVRTVCLTNYVLLCFNLLPIYPLDGGQILQSLLWFILGRARSLMVATGIGFVGVAGLCLLAVVFYLSGARQNAIMLGLVSVFVLLNCWRGLLVARQLARLAKLPRRSGYACPECKQPPIIGRIWRCATCLTAFDTFETHSICPNCGTPFPVTRCPDCGAGHPIGEWLVPPPVPKVTSGG
jgi:Zn-dependent protease